MQSNSITQNKGISYIFIGIALLIGIFLLRPTYASYIQNKDAVTQLQKQFLEIETEYNTLLSIKNSSGSGTSTELISEIQKISKPFDTTEIMSVILLNEFTRDDIGDPTIAISSLNVNKGSKLPNGLSLGSVTLSLQGKTVADIVSFITFLTKNSPYFFTLNEISLPIDTSPESLLEGAYGLNISLGVYYYE